MSPAVPQLVPSADGDNCTLGQRQADLRFRPCPLVRHLPDAAAMALLLWHCIRYPTRSAWVYCRIDGAADRGGGQYGGESRPDVPPRSLLASATVATPLLDWASAL